MNQTLRVFRPGQAWYIPTGSASGEFPVNDVVLSIRINNDRGYQYAGGTLYVSKEQQVESLIEIVK